jgi:clan AA aspartic protease
MIAGIVTGLQARVEVVFCLPDQSERTIECVVDTGFEGELALPTATVASLGLAVGGRIWANLADDRDVPVSVCDAVILWAERETEITVMAMGRRPLIGTELLAGFNLSADFEPDGELTLTPL